MIRIDYLSLILSYSVFQSSFAPREGKPGGPRQPRLATAGSCPRLLDLGTSLVTGRSTITTVKDFFPNTLKLALVAWVWSVVVSIPLGVLAALHRNKIPDMVIMRWSRHG